MPESLVTPLCSPMSLHREIGGARFTSSRGLAIALALTLVLGSTAGATRAADAARAAATAATADAGAGSARDARRAKPRLVVVVSIDQLRADYLERFRDLYLPVPASGKPGGFLWLMEKGAYHLDARHDHFHLFTGPG